MFVKKELENEFRNILKRKTFPPISPKSSKCLDYIGDDINCYGYIWGLDKSEMEHLKKTAFSVNQKITDLWELGLSTEDWYKYYDKSLVSNLFISDMNYLNIGVYKTDLKTKTSENQMKIALYVTKFDFHFVRQNDDKSWSYKDGRFGGCIKLKGNPPKNLGYYDLEGIYMLTQNATTGKDSGIIKNNGLVKSDSGFIK